MSSQYDDTTTAEIPKPRAEEAQGRAQDSWGDGGAPETSSSNEAMERPSAADAAERSRRAEDSWGDDTDGAGDQPPDARPSNQDGQQQSEPLTDSHEQNAEADPAERLAQAQESWADDTEPAMRPEAGTNAEAATDAEAGTDTEARESDAAADDAGASAVSAFGDGSGEDDLPSGGEQRAESGADETPRSAEESWADDTDLATQSAETEATWPIDHTATDDSSPEERDAAADRKMAQDIVSLRVEQDIVRQQGDGEGVENIDEFIGKLAVSDAIKDDPQAYLDALERSESWTADEAASRDTEDSWADDADTAGDRPLAAEVMDESGWHEDEAISKAAEDPENTWAATEDQPPDTDEYAAADRKMAEDIVALRAEEEILREQGNEQAIADIEAFIGKLPVNDEIKADPQGYLDALEDAETPHPSDSPPLREGPDAGEPLTPAEPRDSPQERWSDAMDRRMAEDIVALRAEEEILREQGNEEAIAEIEAFIGKLPVSDEIRADPEAYLASAGATPTHHTSTEASLEYDGAADVLAEQRERGLEILAEHFENLGLEVFEMGRDTQSGRAYFESSDALDQFTQLLSPLPDTYTVALHGSQDAAFVSGVPVTASEVADMIRADPKFEATQVVRLHSCHTGADTECFAQALANELGVPVEAPTNYAWLDRRGNAWVGGMDRVPQPDGTYAERPSAPTAGDGWRTFWPPGSADDTATAGPPRSEATTEVDPREAAAGSARNVALGFAFGARLVTSIGITDAISSPADPVPPVMQTAGEHDLPGECVTEPLPPGRPVDEAVPTPKKPMRPPDRAKDQEDDDPNDARDKLKSDLAAVLGGERGERSHKPRDAPPKEPVRDRRPVPYWRGKGRT